MSTRTAAAAVVAVGLIRVLIALIVDDGTARYPPTYTFPQSPHPRRPERSSDNHTAVRHDVVADGTALTVTCVATRGATTGLVLLALIVVGSMTVLVAVLTNSHHPRR